MRLTIEQLRDKVNEVGPVWLYYPDEYELLYRYAGLSNGPILEIGTAFGGSACILTLGSTSVQVTSIDPFGEAIDGLMPNSNKVYENVVKVLGKESKRWTLWQTTSQVAALSYKKETFALVFIDGNHEYEAVKSDVKWWLPLIRRGGKLILHDSNRHDSAVDVYCMGYDGPTKAAQELKANKKVRLIETAYSMTVWEVL